MSTAVPASPRLTPDNRPSGRSAAASHLISPAALMSIKGLEFRARVVVEGFWSGLHRSPHHGFSVEFTEYRPYTPGEDPRFLDWRLYARSDRFYLKKFEEETNVRCVLAVDNSRSMEYGSLAYNKTTYAKTLAATLAYFLYQQGDAVGLLLFDEVIRQSVPARHRIGHLRQVMLALEHEVGGKETDLIAPLRQLAGSLKKRSTAIVVSDFLAPIDGVLNGLALLAAAKHEVVVFQVLDPMEIEFAIGGPSLLRDLESGRDLFVNPAALQTEYLSRLKQHNEALQNRCQGLGMTYQLVRTDQPLELMLFGFLNRQMRRHGALRRGSGR